MCEIWKLLESIYKYSITDLPTTCDFDVRAQTAVSQLQW